MGSHCVVVGGGVIGLFAAAMLKKRYDNVTLIERDHHFGGLLDSFQTKTGAWYDYGTHIPGLNGRPEIDSILYGTPDEVEQKFHKFTFLKSENYFGAQWYPTSPLVNARSLPEKVYQKGIVELFSTQVVPGHISNLAEFLIANFGETFTQSIYRPIIKKLLGAPLEDLTREVIRTFGLQRIIVLDSEITKELKSLPRLDAKLGFHSYTDGDPSNKYIYPRGNFGVGKFITDLVDKLKKSGIRLIPSVSVSKVEAHGKQVKSVLLSNGENLACDYLAWTVAAPLFLKAASIPFESVLPQFRTTGLFHFEFDLPLLKAAPQYLLVWEPEMLSYRITLYPNITDQKERKEHNNLTVEILTDTLAGADLGSVQARIHQELIAMKIVPSNAKIIDSIQHVVEKSFPITTPAFIESSLKNRRLAESHFDNLMILGRASGAAFFINDLLTDTYSRLKNG